jgi:hypothetical protein
MRLYLLPLVAVFATVAVAESPKTPDAPGAAVRGKLVQRDNQKPVIETAGHKIITLEGDESTIHVLHDKRLAGLQVEAKGHLVSPGHFQVDPFHTRALYAFKDGKRLRITYWCDVCSIRSYEPGPCWCCQRETDLDLREPDRE